MTWHKYSAKQTNGYASKREANRAAELQALSRAGIISELREQVKFELLPAQKGKLRNERPLGYVADFVFEDKCGRHVVDTKGYRTREYVIKRKLMLFVHKIQIEEE